MKRAVILTIGSRGDVEPCIALGARLKRVGWTVRVGALTPFREDIESRGLEFYSVGALPERFRNHRGPGFSGVVGRALFWGIYQRLLASYLPVFVEACRGADLIVYNGLAFPSYHVAEAMKVPCASVAFVPGAPTSEFLNPLYVDRRLSRGPVVNRATFFAEQSLMMQSTAHSINRWRTEALGIRPVERARLIEHRWKTTSAVLLGISDAVVTRPRDWGERIHMTGYFFLDAEPQGTPDPRLLQFLESGALPVYVGFGSMTNDEGTRLATTVIETLRQLGLRGVLARGWGGLKVDRGEVPPHIYLTDTVPHRWLFERVRLAVHHGGAGTTAAALRAGIPSIVVPFNYDQLYWGRLLAERGWGPDLVLPRNLMVETFSSALRQIESTPSYRDRVKPVADRLMGEDGVGNAVRVLDRLV